MSNEKIKENRELWTPFEKELITNDFTEINDTPKSENDFYVAYFKKLNINYILVVFCNLARGFKVRAEIHLKTHNPAIAKAMKEFIKTTNYYANEYKLSPINELKNIDPLIIKNSLNLSEAKKKIGGKILDDVLFQSDQGSLIGTDSVLVGKYCTALAKYKNGITLDDLQSVCAESQLAIDSCSILHRLYQLPK